MSTGSTPLFDTQVRGISPAEAADALIRLEWVQKAAKRHQEPSYQTGGEGALGVDVANSLNGNQAPS